MPIMKIEILEAAEEAEADLIVVGSHRPAMKDYLLGTNASRVMRHARCSVLVARERGSADPAPQGSVLSGELRHRPGCGINRRMVAFPSVRWFGYKDAKVGFEAN
jgi:hypothetical protein